MAKGLDLTSFFKQLDARAIIILDKVDEELDLGMEDIVNEAKAKAPVDVLGNPISSSISLTKNGRFSYTINVDNPYAAYYEFGTGPAAKAYLPSIPKEWQDIAFDYIINEKGSIPEISYLYPAYKNNIDKVISRIKSILDA